MPIICVICKRMKDWRSNMIEALAYIWIGVMIGMAIMVMIHTDGDE